LKELQALLEYLLDSYRFQRIIPDHHSGSKIDLLLKLRKNRDELQKKKKQSSPQRTKQFSNTYTSAMNIYDLLGDGDFDFRDAVAEFPDDEDDHNDEDDKHHHHYHIKADIENYEKDSPVEYFHPLDTVGTMIIEKTQLDISHRIDDNKVKEVDHDKLISSPPYHKAIQSVHTPSSLSLDTVKLPTTDSIVAIKLATDKLITLSNNKFDDNDGLIMSDDVIIEAADEMHSNTNHTMSSATIMHTTQKDLEPSSIIPLFQPRSVVQAHRELLHSSLQSIHSSSSSSSSSSQLQRILSTQAPSTVFLSSSQKAEENKEKDVVPTAAVVVPTPSTTTAAATTTSTTTAVSTTTSDTALSSTLFIKQEPLRTPDEELSSVLLNLSLYNNTIKSSADAPSSSSSSSSFSILSPIAKFQHAASAVMALKDLMKSEEEEDDVDDYGEDFDVFIDYGAKFHPDHSSEEEEDVHILIDNEL
jgi:hypothetical protein